MKLFTPLQCVLLSLLAAPALPAQTTIISDDFNVTGSGTGFALGSGVNTLINPPSTRLTGTAAANLRYFQTDTGRAAANYGITATRFNITAASGNGRVTLSDNGTSAFDFGSSLGTASASAANPLTYDVTISMANNQSGTTRFSFALGTVENNANFWDFGIQLYKAATGDANYTIGKRIDQVSSSTATDSTGATGDINAAMLSGAAAGAAGSQVNFLMRVTDAGAESTTFNSRIRVSLDNGATWFYDTASDSALANGFRFDTTSRFFMFDTAGGGSGSMNYDNFSVTLVPEPTVVSLGLLGAGLLFANRRKAAR